MKKFFLKPFRWTAVFSVILTFSVTFVLLDTFVIPRAGTPINTTSSKTTSTASDTILSSDSSNNSSISTANKQLSSSQTSSSKTSSLNSSSSQTNPVVTDNSYEDENIKISIETVQEYNTTMYIADIQVSDIAYLKAAFAKDTYGRNYKETTSTIAENNNAIFAINGDYYGFRNYGFVLRNGVLYRNTAYTDEALVIDSEGNFSIINENKTDAQTLADSNVWQIFSFGPALINNGEIAVTANSEVDQSMTSNPRTAIGQVSALHYIVIVSDGRTSESQGLSLLELAQEFYSRGCTVAYNLDGGGSSTMWFNGEVINNPTTNGNSISERSVSDIVYFGY